MPINPAIIDLASSGLLFLVTKLELGNRFEEAPASLNLREARASR